MRNRKYFLLKIILAVSIVSELIFVSYFLFQKNKQSIPPRPNSYKVDQLKIFSEKIPGSNFHNPDATWWGYNQNKIVRFKDIVFMYVVDNIDDKNTTLSQLVIYKKEGDNPWEKGASFPTSRPGNILIDFQGVLHAFVFEPFDVAKNDSWGKLIHYWFPDSSKGDITNYKKEIIVDNDGTIETANIRVGSAIGVDDTMALGFGLTTFNPLYKGHSEHLYFKKPSDFKWTHLIAGENLGHDWYYPFVWVENGKFHLLPVQDDYNGQGAPQMSYPNIYQKIVYMNYVNNAWTKELIVDLSTHPLAKSRPRLLEQEELYIDKKGRVHILYKEFLDKDTPWKTTHKHIIKNATGTSEQDIDTGKDSINWIRIFEVNNSLYYLYVFYDSAYVKKEGTNKLVKLDIPKDAHGMYPYIATKRGGTRDQGYVDMLFLSADQYDFRDGTNINYYIRIPKAYLTNL